MTLDELNRRFVYKLDSEQFGFNEVWLGLQDVDGKLVGDCEDYAISVKNKVPGFKDWNYYWCRMNGEGHCILSNGVDMVDNNVQRVISLDKYKKMCEVTELRPYKWYELVWKFGSAKVLSVWLNTFGK
jgi:predicted transglutaminase-like cysteine proteinase